MLPHVNPPPVVSDQLLVAIALAASLLAIASLWRVVRRGRGSQLRAMLVMLMALSVLFGLARHSIERQRREELAAARLLDQGLGIAFEPCRPEWFWSLASKASGRNYRHAVRVSSEFKSVYTDSDESGVLGDEALAALIELPWLKTIELSCPTHNGGPFVTPSLSDKAAMHLAGLKRLEQADLAGQPLTDACLPHLGELTGLSRLDLTGTNLSPAGISRLRQLLPRTTILEP